MASAFHKIIRLYRDAYSGHPRQIWALALLTLINRMGTMVLPFLSVYLVTRLDFSLKEAGLLISAFGLGSLGGSWLGGKLSDRIGANRVIVLSLMSSGILFILLQFPTSFLGLFLMIFVTALFGEAYRPAMMVSVGYYVGKAQSGRTMSLLRLAINLGMSAGPAIGGYLAATMGYSWLFWFDGLTGIAAAAYFAYVSRSWKKSDSPDEAAADKGNEPRKLHPLRNRNYRVFLFSTLLMSFGFMQWFHSVPVFLKTNWGFDERYIGLLLGISSILITVVEMPAIHRIEKKKKIRKAMAFGFFLIGLAYTLLLFPRALIVGVVAVVIWTLGEILSLPLNSATALNMSPDKGRGNYIAWYWMTWSFTNVLAPVVGLSFADAFGFSAFWIFLAALMGLSLLVFWSIPRRVFEAE